MPHGATQMRVLPECLRTTLLMALLSAGPAMGATYLVRPNGTGDFATIQDAIDAVINGDIIELTSGTFSGDGNRDLDYRGKAITVRSRSGDPESCVIDCGGGEPDWHRGLNFHRSEGPGSVLEGVTITNAYTDSPISSGGGVYCDRDSDPTLINCVFLGNTAYFGGGLACYFSSLTVVGCRFEGNSAARGAGMTARYSSPTLIGCTFSGNAVSGGEGDNLGGGVFLEQSNPEFTECEFLENTTNGSGGGIYCYSGSSPVLTKCTLSGNTANVFGGGLVCWALSSPVLNDCMIWENIANLFGGGIYCDGGSSPALIECTISGNDATQCGGGLYCGGNTLAALTKCTLTMNSAGVGGGIYCDSNAAPTLANVIVAFSENGEAIHCDDDGTPTLTCCDVYGNAGGDWVDCISGQFGVDGNISEDPLFCNPENVDFTIRSDSPCAPFSPPNEECDLIGAWPVTCYPPTPTHQATWGQIKAEYRR